MKTVAVLFSDTRSYLEGDADEQIETARALIDGGVFHSPPYTKIEKIEVGAVVLSLDTIGRLVAALDVGSCGVAASILRHALAGQVYAEVAAA